MKDPMKVFDKCKDGETLILTGHGINWCWYLEVKVVWPHGNIKVEILKHWRGHRSAGNHPTNTKGSFVLLENTKRTVCAVHLIFKDCDTVAAVENPAWIWDYPSIDL